MRFGYGGPVDRHGLLPRDDKGGVDAMCLSLRGGSGARDAVIHPISEDVGGVVCSVTVNQWIATGYRPRDDNTLLSLRGGSGAKDAAIHRVSEGAGGVVCSVTEGQWIATG
ncbi:hypothetical protein N9H45_06800, partial [Opitutales bacterium]|nr:hypothetical protein [Opitutales bacterium]